MSLSGSEMQKKILLTGSTGFVGSALLSALKSRSHEVVAVSQFGGNGTIARPFQDNPDWHDLLSGVDCIIHTGARAHVMHESAADPLALFRQVNVLPTLKLAEQAASHGVKRFVFLSSVKVNGEDSPNPSQSISETDLPSPQDPYGISKYEAEQGLHAISARTGIEIVVIRPPLVYGPEVKANFHALIRLVVSGLPLPLGAISNQRSMVGLRNLVSFIITCSYHPAAANQTFVVSDGHDVSTLELVEKMCLVSGRQPRIFSLPVALLRLVGLLTGKRAAIDRLCGSLHVDISKARSLLSWEPPYSLVEELAVTMRQHKEEHQGVEQRLNNNNVEI